MRAVGAALLVGLATLLACGKYGAPLRPSQRGEPAEEDAPAAEQATPPAPQQAMPEPPEPSASEAPQ